MTRRTKPRQGNNFILRKLKPQRLDSDVPVFSSGDIAGGVAAADEAAEVVVAADVGRNLNKSASSNRNLHSVPKSFSFLAGSKK